MNYNNLCINCMRIKQEGEHKCPYCGFDERYYDCPPYALLPKTPLNGIYIVGKMLGAFMPVSFFVICGIWHYL